MHITKSSAEEIQNKLAYKVQIAQDSTMELILLYWLWLRRNWQLSVLLDNEAFRLKAEIATFSLEKGRLHNEMK